MNTNDNTVIDLPELKGATPQVWMAIGRYQSAVGELTLKDDEVLAQRDLMGGINHEFLESLKRSQRYKKWCKSRLADFGLSEETIGEIARLAKVEARSMRVARQERLANLPSY